MSGRPNLRRPSDHAASVPSAVSSKNSVTSCMTSNARSGASCRDLDAEVRARGVDVDHDRAPSSHTHFASAHAAWTWPRSSGSSSCASITYACSARERGRGGVGPEVARDQIGERRHDLIGEPRRILGAIARDERDRLGTVAVVGHAVALREHRQRIGQLRRRQRDQRDLARAAAET